MLKNSSTKMLSDSKIRGWGAPRIYFEESFKEMSLVSASERKEELEGPRSLMECRGCGGAGRGASFTKPPRGELREKSYDLRS